MGSGGILGGVGGGGEGISGDGGRKVNNVNKFVTIGGVRW